MRVKVIGTMDAAAVLRGWLVKDGTVALAKGDEAANCTIILEHGVGDEFYFDSIDCELERSVFRHVRDLSNSHIEIRTKGGNTADDTLRIVFPEKESRAIESGVLRGFVDFAGPKRSALTAPAPFVAPAPTEIDFSPILQAHQANSDRLLQEKQEWADRLIGEKDRAHAQRVEEIKAHHAAAMADCEGTIQALTGQINELSVKARAADENQHGAERAADLERFYSGVIADKDAAHAKAIEDLKQNHGTALADRDRQIQDLQAERGRLNEELASARQASAPGAAQVLSHKLEVYERLLKDKDALIEWLKGIAHKPWWKRVLGL